jgi:hypothetical protein
MTREQRLREALVVALLHAIEDQTLSPKLAGEVLDEWDELSTRPGLGAPAATPESKRAIV